MALKALLAVIEISMTANNDVCRKLKRAKSQKLDSFRCPVIDCASFRWEIHADFDYPSWVCGER